MAEWRENYPESDRPDDDALREIHWVQGGVPIARQALVREDDGSAHGKWSLSPMKYAFFGGRGVELAWWYWARDEVEVSDRYKRIAARMAGELEAAAEALRKIAECAEETCKAEVDSGRCTGAPGHEPPHRNAAESWSPIEDHQWCAGRPPDGGDPEKVSRARGEQP